jgi:hypothetical protein
VDPVQTPVADLPPGAAAGDELVICPHFRVGDRVIRAITVAARLEDPST